MSSELILDTQGPELSTPVTQPEQASNETEISRTDSSGDIIVSRADMDEKIIPRDTLIADRILGLSEQAVALMSPNRERLGVETLTQPGSLDVFIESALAQIDKYDGNNLFNLQDRESLVRFFDLARETYVQARKGVENVVEGDFLVIQDPAEIKTLTSGEIAQPMISALALTQEISARQPQTSSEKTKGETPFFQVLSYVLQHPDNDLETLIEGIMGIQTHTGRGFDNWDVSGSQQMQEIEKNEKLENAIPEGDEEVKNSLLKTMLYSIKQEYPNEKKLDFLDQDTALEDVKKKVSEDSGVQDLLLSFFEQNPPPEFFLKTISQWLDGKEDDTKIFGKPAEKVPNITQEPPFGLSHEDFVWLRQKYFEKS